MLVLNRSAYEQQLAVRDAVRDALINDREAAIETLRTNFMEVLYRMSDEQIAERIIQGSSADELKALHESLIGEVDDSEISDHERTRP